MKRLMILILCVCLALSVTACSRSSDGDTPISQVSPESLESVEVDVSDKEAAVPQSSQPNSIQIEKILPLFEDKAKSEFGLDIQNTEPLGEMPVENEIWYKFRVTTENEGLVYLVNADMSRVYLQMDNIHDAAMNDAYSPLIDNILPIAQEDTEEERQRLYTLLAPIMYTDAGQDATGNSIGTMIINNEFCLVMTAVRLEGMESTYIATYAISIDGERYYKLGDDGYFRAM